MQPAAQRWFGARVVEIRQISAYSCRGMNGNPNAHISEHAFGNALDIAAFTLADGRRISVKDGWHGLPEEQGFLRDVQGAACQQFNTVLAPGSNQYHDDHIHVDLMRRASGRIICEPAAVSGEQIAARAAGRNPYASSRDSYVTGSLGGRAHKHKSATAKVNEEDEFEDECLGCPSSSKRRGFARASERGHALAVSRRLPTTLVDPRTRGGMAPPVPQTISAASASSNAGNITIHPSFRNCHALTWTASRRSATSQRMVASEPVTDEIRAEIDADQDRRGDLLRQVIAGCD